VLGHERRWRADERDDFGEVMTDRPLPKPDDASAEFWAAARRHELVMQRCTVCGKLRYPPRPMCPACQSLACDWPKMSGRGAIYSFVIAHAPVLPAFAERVPLPIVLVALEEEPTLRLVGNLVEPAGDRLRIGARVVVAFEDLGEVTLPQWRIID
jgi:uncharacterized OB-fold protein